MWRALNNWLGRAPIADPVDRRNAPVMQLLLMFIGCVVPLNSAYYVFIVGLRHRPGWIVDLGTDAIMAIMAWVGFALIRRGRFRLAIVLFLATVLVSAGAAYASAGFDVSLSDKIPLLLLALGGLVLGRRALWVIFGLLMIIFALGMRTDIMRIESTRDSIGHVLSNGPPVVIGYLIIAIILDRTIAALRESLAESNERGVRLQHEIIQRERAQEQLLHAQKMEAIGRLSSGVAHDFNNILGVILGFASERDQLDEPDMDPREEARVLAEALEGVEMAARRGAAISHKLLSFSRSDVTRLECFDVGEIVREITPMLRQMFGAEVKMSVEMDESVPLTICFDRTQFELLLLNLAANARDAMPDGGRFTVRINGVFALDHRVVITLADDGKGMSEDVQSHIFEPFYTTKPSGSGTGLGLAVTYRLITAAGGTISVLSKLGEGTIFRIVLPLVGNPATAAASPTNRSVIRILLVEDDNDLRQVLVASLIHHGCEVDAAADAGQALQMVEKIPSHDVLVCDHHMPDVQDDELYRSLRSRLPTVPIILISSTQGTAVDDPYVTRLPKPFAPASLARLVRQIAADQPPMT